MVSCSNFDVNIAYHTGLKIIIIDAPSKVLLASLGTSADTRNSETVFKIGGTAFLLIIIFNRLY